MEALENTTDLITVETQELPKAGFVRLPQILSIIPIGKSSWWAGVKSGKYPKGIKHGRVTLWKAQDIHALIAHITNSQGV